MILMHDHRELIEQTSRNLKRWRAWHTTMYFCANVFAVVNYVYMDNAIKIVNNNCIVYPRLLEFHVVKKNNVRCISQIEDIENARETVPWYGIVDADFINSEANDNSSIYKENYKMLQDIYKGNLSYHMVLDTARSLFCDDMICDLVLYIPIIAIVFGVLWLSFFHACHTGSDENGLPQPWRMLPIALIFAVFMMGITGYNFSATSNGIQAFCDAFMPYTNSTDCAAINDYLEFGWTGLWGFSGQVAAARWSSGGLLASWALAAAILLARCLRGPDFQVKRVTVYLDDPSMKIRPYIGRSPVSQDRTQVSFRSLFRNDALVSIQSKDTDSEAEKDDARCNCPLAPSGEDNYITEVSIEMDYLKKIPL